MTVQVMKPGLYTTIQDGGRWGLQRYGVSVSGSMDRFAHRVANILVGNHDDAAVLEATLQGPELLLRESCWVALCGADMRPQANGRPVPMWRPVHLSGGTLLTLSRAVAGCRTYIAFAGGMDTSFVLGSRSTHVRSALGGIRGRALLEGDELPLHKADKATLPASPCPSDDKTASVPWFVSPYICPDYAASAVVRTIDAPETGWFSPEDLDRFYTQSYRVAVDSDRMGVRLTGAQSTVLVWHAQSMRSSPVTFGTVQLPPNGQPIVLAADRQTTGGYPRIAHVVSADLPILAQLRPGDELRFERISHIAAEQLSHKLESDLALLRQAVRLYAAGH